MDILINSLEIYLLIGGLRLWEKMGCKVGGKVLLKELIRSCVNIEIDRTKTDINHFIEIDKG